MDFLQTLKAHKGGLIRLKTQLYWYNRGWDGVPDRVCLVLDASAVDGYVRLAPVTARGSDAADTAVLLLIDGAPRWVWVAQEDVELIA